MHSRPARMPAGTRATAARLFSPGSGRFAFGTATAALVLFGTVCTAPLFAELVVPIDTPPPAGKPNTIAVPNAAGAPGGDPAATTKPAGDQESPDLLYFLNGDKMRGKLLQADADKNTMKWKTAQAQQDIMFNLPGLKEVVLGERTGLPSPPLAEGSFIVSLKNGDEIPGTIISMDDKNLVLETPYAGTLTIDRKALAGLVPIRGSTNILYDGPKDMEGWETQQGQRNTWRYKDGAMISTRNGFTGKDFKLPDLSSIEFDLSWSGNFSLGLSIYTDELKGYGGNAYMLQIGNGYLYMNRMSRNGGQNQMGQAQVESMQRKNSARFRLCTNKEQKSIALFVDDALVKTWKDTGNFAGGGTGISFYNQGQGLIRLRRIRISKWDGRIAEEATTGKAAASADDSILLANQDKVTGKITAIKGGSATLESPYATLQVPLPRIDVITFAAPEAIPKKPEEEKKDKEDKDDKKPAGNVPANQPEVIEQPEASGENNPNAPKPPTAPVVEAPKRVPGEVGIHLNGRGRLTLKLEKWDADKLIGTSASAGKIQILPQA
ncbi:MAG TPA: hypothetical protein VK970_26605, partial [Candidatus Methylacidiphilales bacterium]|nr:hypothetical protein [Candidatus Methylacidiphilales bacterium]